MANHTGKKAANASGQAPASTLSPKRELLLATAEDLMRQLGIRRVRVEEICRRAGIAKATFYKYFPNRDAIALEVLDRIASPLRQQYEGELFGPQPFAERLLRLLSLKREGPEHFGPVLIADLLEAPLPGMRNWLQREQARSYELGLRFFRAGQAAGAINPHFSPEYMIYLLDVAQGMFQDPRLKAIYPDIPTRSDVLTQFLLFGFSTVPGSEANQAGRFEQAEASHGP